MNRSNFVADEANGNLKLAICPIINCNCGTLLVTFHANSSDPVEFEINVFEWDYVTYEEGDKADRLEKILEKSLQDDEVRYFLYERYFELKREQAAADPLSTPYEFGYDPVFVFRYGFVFPFDNPLTIIREQSKYLVLDTYFEDDDRWDCMLTPIEMESDEPIRPIMYLINHEKKTLTLGMVPESEIPFGDDELLKLINEQIPEFWELVEKRYSKLKAAYVRYMESDDLEEDYCPYNLDDDDFDDDDFDDDELEDIFDRAFAPPSEFGPMASQLLSSEAVLLHERLQPVLTGFSGDSSSVEIEFAPRIPDRTAINLLVEDNDELLTWRVSSLRELFRGDRPAPQFANNGEPPAEYEFYFRWIESFIPSYCAAADVEPSDNEFVEIFSAVRRRPDGKRISDLHDAIWQIAALLLGIFPLSQAEFEAIFLRLEQSARHVKAVSSTSSNYLHMINGEHDRMFMG